MLCKLQGPCFLLILVLCLAGCTTVRTRWADTVSQDTIASYEEFIKRHPDSEYADEARTRLETLHLEKARATDSAEGWLDFLLRFPESKHIEDALDWLKQNHPEFTYETASLDEARATDTAEAYASFLARFPDSRHAEDVRHRLKEIRCSDSTLMRAFPAWLRQGTETDPQQGARWTLGETYVGAGERPIGSGYKVIGDDPAWPISVEHGPGYLRYLGGKGILIGPDDSRILVGYSCE